MSEHPRDEFDDVPEDGARQGAHRGHNPRAREGSTRQFRTVLLSGVLALVLGAVCFVNAPRTAQEAQPRERCGVPGRRVHRFVRARRRRRGGPARTGPGRRRARLSRPAFSRE